MATPANRMIGRNLVVEFLPTGVTEQTSVWSLDISGSPTSGSFYLWLNGEQTAAIAHDADSAAIEAALEALPSVEAADISVSGTSPEFTVTAAGNLANKYNTLSVGAVSFDAGSIAVTVDTAGQGTITITGDFTNFSYNRQTDMADLTAGNGTARYEKPTIENMDWSLSIFQAKQSYVNVIQPQATGQMWVYPDGIGSGKPYFSFNAVIGGFNETYPFDDAIEIEMSGVRQGEMLIEVGSVQS